MVKTTPLYNFIGKQSTHIESYRGGRGSGKTHTLIQKLLQDFATESRCNYLFSVKQDSSAVGSVLPRCQQIIKENNLESFFKITKSPARIVNKLGRILFIKGFDEPAKIKQLPQIGVSYLDETDQFTYEDFKTVLGTTREIDNYKVYLAFNPISESSWIKIQLYDDQRMRKRITDIHSTCEDNPFLPESKKQEYRQLTGIDYEVDYLGNWGSIASELVFGSRLRVVEEIPNHAQYLSTGLDFTGFANDPNAMIEVYYADGELYLKELLYEVCEIVSFDGNRDVLTVVKEESTHIGTRDEMNNVHHIIADSADLLSINLLRQHGVYVVGAKKGAGSVAQGIKKLNLYKRINILSTSTNAIYEFRNYKLKKVNGIVTPNIIPNQTDHLIDATRYALESVLL